MEKNMKQKKKTLAEELGRIGDWFAERDLGVRDVIRRVEVVAVGLMGGALSIAVWAIAFMVVGEYFRTGDWGWIVGGLGTSGAALLVSCGVVWFVWALWTDEL